MSQAEQLYLYIFGLRIEYKNILNTLKKETIVILKLLQARLKLNKNKSILN